jgi:hypothetical protein
MSDHDLSKLPKWAQLYIQELKGRVRRAELTLPWHNTGREWFTLFAPTGGHDRPPQRLFTCSEEGTHCVCTLSPGDFVFVGRGKDLNIVESNHPTDPGWMVQDATGKTLHYCSTFQEAVRLRAAVLTGGEG